MPYRHPMPRAPKALPTIWPTKWLMTDERMGAGLWTAIRALPRGSGVVFRHYRTEPAARRAIFAKLVPIARRKGLLLMRAGPEIGTGEAGIHGDLQVRRPCLRSGAAHSRREAVAAKRAGATLLFVSPVFPTRSHPGAPALGPSRAAAIGRGLGLTLIALGGMNARRFARLRGLGFHGWAAIDAWSRD